MTDSEKGLDEISKISIPTELSGKTIKSSNEDASETNSNSVVIKADDKPATNNIDITDYAKHVHGYIREYIATADRKASFIFTIGAALLVYLYEKNIVISYLKSQDTLGLSELLAFIAIGCLAASCILSVVIVFPKLSGSRRGLLFWEGISQFSTPNEYSIEVQKTQGNGLTDEMLRHCHELARVCKEKFRLVNWALRIGSVGAISMILFLVTK